MSENPIISEYKEQVKKVGEDLLLNGFPETILRLNTLLGTPRLRKRHLSDIHCTFYNHDKGDNTSGKRARVDECPPRVKTNPHLVGLIETVKPHMLKLVEDAKKMKMWVAFMIPKIEDGNNFGVAVQEDTLCLVQSVETAARIFHERITKYFVERAKIIKSIEKYPDIDDFKRAAQELDEREYLGFCLVLTEIRNNYCTLYDIFLKNLEKIKRPKSNLAAETLY